MMTLSDTRPVLLADRLVEAAEACQQSTADLLAAMQEAARARGLAPAKRKRLLWLAEQVCPLDRDHVFFAVAALREINGGWN